MTLSVVQSVTGVRDKPVIALLAFRANGFRARTPPPIPGQDVRRLASQKVEDASTECFWRRNNGRTQGTVNTEACSICSIKPLQRQRV